MNKEELEKIKTIGIAGTFVLEHLTHHHNFSEEEAKEFMANVSVKLFKIKKEEWNEIIEKSFKKVKK